MTFFKIIYFFFTLSIAGSTNLRDFRGKEFSLPPGKGPNQIVALMPAIAESLFTLGAGAKIVGAPEHTEVPDSFLKSVKILGPYSQLNSESIYSLKPDLVIGSRDGNDAALVAQLEALGLKVFILDSTRLDDIAHSLELLAQIIVGGNTLSKSNHDLVSQFKKAIQFHEVANRPISRPRIFLQLGSSPLITVNDKTFIGEIFTRLGVTNIFGSLQIRYPRISPEEVILANPTHIFICQFTKDDTEGKKLRDYWLQFSKIEAVRSKHLYIMPLNWLTKPGFSIAPDIQVLERYLR